MAKAKKQQKSLGVRIKQWLSLMALIISVLGLITFSLFILEESLQTTMFGTWPAQDAGNWDLVLNGIDTMESINLTMKIVNYSVGWLQPLAFVSYRAYSKATDFYIKGLKAKAFARSPASFRGRVVEFQFEPARIVDDEKGLRMINRNIIVVIKERPPKEFLKFVVRGKVKPSQDNKTVFIFADFIHPVVQ